VQELGPFIVMTFTQHASSYDRNLNNLRTDRHTESVTEP